MAIAGAGGVAVAVAGAVAIAGPGGEAVAAAGAVAIADQEEKQ